jgi:hypothetical protein
MCPVLSCSILRCAATVCCVVDTGTGILSLCSVGSCPAVLFCSVPGLQVYEYTGLARTLLNCVTSQRVSHQGSSQNQRFLRFHHIKRANNLFSIIAVLTSIIVTNKNYIYQGGVVVLFDEKEPKTVTRRERVVYITNKIQKIKASIHSFIQYR